MGFARLVAWSLVAALLTACSPWEINYQPRSAVSPGPKIVEKGVQFYEGDIKTLADAGGAIIGKLDLGVAPGWMLTGGIGELHDKAAEETAERSGSHFLYLDPKISSGTIATAYQAFGSTVVTVNETSELRGARYLLVRVPAQKWQQLPKELRPSVPAVAK